MMVFTSANEWKQMQATQLPTLKSEQTRLGFSLSDNSKINDRTIRCNSQFSYQAKQHEQHLSSKIT